MPTTRTTTMCGIWSQTTTSWATGRGSGNCCPTPMTWTSPGASDPGSTTSRQSPSLAPPSCPRGIPLTPFPRPCRTLGVTARVGTCRRKTPTPATICLYVTSRFAIWAERETLATSICKSIESLGDRMRRLRISVAHPHRMILTLIAILYLLSMLNMDVAMCNKTEPLKIVLCHIVRNSCQKK